MAARLILKCEARLCQVLIHHQEGATGDELERELFILRKLIEKEKEQRIGAAVADQETTQEAEKKGGADPADFYICTLSNRQIVFKVCLAKEMPAIEPAFCWYVLFDHYPCPRQLAQHTQPVILDDCTYLEAAWYMMPGIGGVSHAAGQAFGSSTVTDRYGGC